jgi:hypothetical protein
MLVELAIEFRRLDRTSTWEELAEHVWRSLRGSRDVAGLSRQCGAEFVDSTGGKS